MEKVILTERQKTILRPLIQELDRLDQGGFLASDTKMAPAAYLDGWVWAAILDEFAKLV